MGYMAKNKASNFDCSATQTKLSLASKLLHSMHTLSVNLKVVCVVEFLCGYFCVCLHCSYKAINNLPIVDHADAFLLKCLVCASQAHNVAVVQFLK